MTWLLSHWPAVVAAIAVIVGGAKLWLSRWRVQRALEATRGERDRAEVERDAAIGAAAVADRQAELTAGQARNDADGQAAAEEFANAPTTGSPADRVRALDAAARRLRDEDDPSAVPRSAGGAPVSPRR